MPSLQLPHRVALSLAALLLAALAAGDYAGWRDEQRRLAELYRDGGLDARHPRVRGEVAREPDPELARLRIARALFATELDPAQRGGLAAGEAEDDARRGLERLARARELAAETLPSRPASWRAASILGGATFLELSRRRDPHAGARPELWEEPLLAAHRLAPGHPEPPRLLAAAYLSNWSRLGPAARERARPVLETAFRDPTTFDLLAESWLRVAPSLDAALDVFPSSPPLWAKLEKIVLQRGDLERYRDVHERWYASLRPYMEEILAAGDLHLRLGKTRQAFERYALVSTLPPDRGFVDLLRAALERSPPGEQGSRRSEGYRNWLEWTLDLCALGDCPLPAAAVARLAELASELSPAERAFSALVGGTGSLADLYERKAPSLASEEWQPYLIYKARRLAAHGRTAEAAEALDRLSVEAMETPLYWQARLELALQAGDSEAAEQARSGLASRARPDASDRLWRTGRRGWRQDVLAPAAAGRVTVELLGLSTQGAVVEARWDGAITGFFYATPGDRLRLALPVTPGLHRLEIHRLSGKGALPGRVTLGETAAG